VEAEKTRLEDLEARLDRLETRLENAGRETTLMGMMDRLVPRDVRRHMRNAQREQLLAMRTWIDHIIGRIDEAEQQQGGTRRRIEVQ
jgi:hypothetical protein